MVWALVFMMCSRGCQPQYVEVYSTKAACEAKIVKSGFFESQRTFCVPVTRGDA